VVKRLSGHAKVRYRGLAKNNVQLFALSNLYMPRYGLGAA
jgi:IS5 family transposase